jgi:hypothetical protein
VSIQSTASSTQHDVGRKVLIGYVVRHDDFQHFVAEQAALRWAALQHYFIRAIIYVGQTRGRSFNWCADKMT